MTGYTDTIRKYATDDRFTGELSDPDGVGEVGLGAEEAGRRLAVRFSLRATDERVTAVRFQVFGCGFTIAACAAAAELADGCRLDQLATIDAGRIDAVLHGLPSERAYCAQLAAEALQAAVASTGNDRTPVQVGLEQQAEHAPRVAADDPLYRLLLATRCPATASAADRQLFACLLTVAAGEPHGVAAALGLSRDELADLLRELFPGAVLPPGPKRRTPPPTVNRDVRQLLLGYALQGGGRYAVCLAKVIAARAAHPGHLWIAMGLFERPELSAAIRRHLPAMAAANSGNMRWKRFLFKQVCELQGGGLCKVPDCRLCSDYALCFAPEP